MAQHDYIIADADGATVLADLNDAFQAIASTNKGPSAPSTAYTGQLWLDDSTPSANVWTLNVYDGAGWIPVGTVDTVNNVFTPAQSGGGRIGSQVITSSQTYTPAPGTNRVVHLVGGGASGCRTNASLLGTGGGGGGYARKELTTGFSGVSVTIGAGGAAQTSDAAGGNNGGTTSFGAVFSATGGVGGDVSNNAAVAGGNGSGGDVNVAGKPGWVLQGSSAGISVGGAGAVLGCESMVVGVSTSANGKAYGGGGTGSGTGNNSGAGSAGVCIIEEYA